MRHNNSNCDIDIKKVKDMQEEKSTAKVHSYDEAIALAGTGRYGLGLLATLSLAILGMGIDMFGFALVVTASNCDFHLTHVQKSIALIMPFLGPVVTAYPWGYLADTRGRKASLVVALWGSFVLSSLSAFAPNWILLAVLRFCSTCFCSCANSAGYALLAESSPVRQKGTYMLIMSSILNFGFMIYMNTAFFVLPLPFAVDLGFITFVSWRLLTITLALPLGISALCLHCFYESPKFLISLGREKEALQHLHNIWRRNGRKGDSYPVNKVVLNEETTVNRRDTPFLKSLWNQTAPLFRPPLLFNTFLLYYLTTAVYIIIGGLFIWFPFLAKAFADGILSSPEGITGLCNMIYNSKTSNSTQTSMACPATVEAPIAWAALGEGVSFAVLSQIVAQLSMWKKYLTLAILFVCAASAVLAVVVANNVAALIFFFGVLIIVMVGGLVFTYYVDLYPTCYRGMSACLGVMVARLSSAVGVYAIGAFLTTQCEMTFYVISLYLFSAVAVACFLPRD